MRNGFRIYDTHAHLGAARHSGRTCSADEMLRAMDRGGVDRAALIPFPVVEDERAAHDEIGRAVRAHPDRFTGVACLYPFQPLAAFRTEARRCAEELGFRALKLQPQYQPLNPISPRSDFYFETALEHSFVLICHTGTGAPFALPSLFIMPARKFPGLSIVLGHAGGSVYVAEAIVAASVCPNIYIEVSSLMPHHITEVLAHIPSSRLMAGADLPESIETEFGKITGMDIPAEAKTDILWHTPRRVFDGEA
ncbi:MAG: amidohydrolase family protein [Bryobacteraceae bacterium]|nr:amidohydrolase family protein [Bryobacteraceae bacterium]